MGLMRRCRVLPLFVQDRRREAAQCLRRSARHADRKTAAGTLPHYVAVVIPAEITAVWMVFTAAPAPPASATGVTSDSDDADLSGAKSGTHPLSPQTCWTSGTLLGASSLSCSIPHVKARKSRHRNWHRKLRVFVGFCGNPREAPSLASPTPARDPRVLLDSERYPVAASRGRRFKSCQPDRKALVRIDFPPGLRHFCCPFRSGLWKHPTADTDASQDASITAVATSRELAGTWSPLWAAIGSLLIADVPSLDRTLPGCRAQGSRVREERVGACGSIGEVPGVGVEVRSSTTSRFGGLPWLSLTARTSSSPRPSSRSCSDRTNR